jgi:hypothetical protein
VGDRDEPVLAGGEDPQGRPARRGLSPETIGATGGDVVVADIEVSYVE